MSFEISRETIQSISDILAVEVKQYGNHFRFQIRGEEITRQLSIELYPKIPIGNTEGAMVSVFTPNSNLQLQHLSGVVVSEMMGEVTFVAEAGGKVSGLIVEKQGGCSLYANVDRSLLSGDFTNLGPEVMMSSIALSLTEHVLPDEGGGDETEYPSS